MNGAASQGRTQVDFEDLAFSGEGHFMSNRKVGLPAGSQRNSFKVLFPSSLSSHATCRTELQMVPVFQSTMQLICDLCRESR